MNEEMQLAWLEISQMLGEPTREELDVFMRTWQRASQATRKAMAEQSAHQEPVAWICYGAPGKRDIDFEEADIKGLSIGTQLYATPPAQRTWVGLTEKEILECRSANHLYFYKAIEAKLKEKNT